MSFEKENKVGFSVRSNVYDTSLGGVSGPCLGYRGFKIGFANGFGISVQFGTVNYCAAQGDHIGRSEAEQGEWLETNCPDAEIAIISPDGNFVPFKDGSDVRGNTTPDSLAEIIAWVAQQPPKNPN